MQGHRSGEGLRESFHQLFVAFLKASEKSKSSKVPERKLPEKLDGCRSEWMSSTSGQVPMYLNIQAELLAGGLQRAGKAPTSLSIIA